MRSSIKVLYWLYKSKKNKQGLISIYIRITLNREKIEISSGYSIQLNQWNRRKKKVVENNAQSIEINSGLDIQKANVTSIYNQLLSLGEFFTVEDIKRKLSGKNEENITLLQAIEYHKNKTKPLIGKTFAQGTYNNYRFLEIKIRGFIYKNYKMTDLPLKQLNHQFISEFAHYLKTIFNNRTNTVAKNMTNLKTIVNLALDMDWLAKNPFRNYKNRKEEPARTYLTAEEVKIVAETTMPKHHLEVLKDCIIFQIYTGVGYADLKKLSISNIITGVDGLQWLEFRRQKTGTRSSIPLLPIALQILNKYNDHPIRFNEGKLLPVTSNQKMNKKIKKIMRLCNIDKNISTHSFRRTFATTITLSNGIPIETVSKMLGHCDLKTTAIYAKVVDKKISDDMRVLMHVKKQENCKVDD